MYDYDQTIELLQRAVAEKGDGHVYQSDPDHLPSCRYANDNGAPSCIVGYALSYVGLLSPELDDQGTVTSLEVARENFTATAILALDAAQNEQDYGETWGQALIAAKEIITNGGDQS